MAIDEKEKAQLEAWKNCKCGGKFRLVIDKMGVEHSYPICDDYDKLDLDQLIRIPGALAHYLFGMEKKKADA